MAAVQQAIDSGNFCICSPLSYAGKARTASNARMAYGIAVDLDNILMEGADNPVGLKNLWNGHIMRADRIPKPTAIVSSGTGLHLYYMLQEPIPLFRNIVEQLQEFKQELTRLIWNEGIVNIKSVYDIQQEGIFQGFRMVGTVTKTGSRARAFLTGDKVTMEYLNEYVEERYRVTQFTYKSKLTLEQAKEKYPDWYKRRIENGEPKGTWHINRNLYDWWKRKILSGATVGHRYNCLMGLVVYAMKCGTYDAKHNPNPVTYEELEKDCFELMEYFETLTKDSTNHFTEGDVLDALQMYKNSYLHYPRKAIEYRSGIQMPANKRNGRKQADHIKIMNFIRDEINGNKNWRDGNGRKPKDKEVIEWRALHPDGKKMDCHKDTGMSRSTIDKYWDLYHEKK